MNWWARYEVWLEDRPFRFTRRKDALWAVRIAVSNGLKATGRDRWFGGLL